MLNNLLFDLDDTLFDFALCEKTALSTTLTDFGITPTEEIIKLYAKINKAQWMLLEENKTKREILTVRRFEILFDTLGLTQDAIKVQNAYEKHLKNQHFLYSGAKELLEKLKKDFRLYAISNGSTEIQTSKIEDSGIKKYFLGIFISQSIGYNKPDRRFFDACFEKIQGTPDKSIVIGDSLTSDILGAINYNMKSIWFCPESKPKDKILPTYEVNDYANLYSLLMKLKGE